MHMKKVIIEPGCISCGTCQFIAPEIFEVTDVSRVRPNAPITDNVEKIEQAIQMCPVQVIKCEK